MLVESAVNGRVPIFLVRGERRFMRGAVPKTGEWYPWSPSPHPPSPPREGEGFGVRPNDRRLSQNPLYGTTPVHE